MRGVGRGTGAGMFGALDEVFHPSGRHVLEERDRQHSLVDDVDSGAPPFRVDLEAGTVRVVRRPRSQPAPEPEPAAAEEA